MCDEEKALEEELDGYKQRISTRSVAALTWDRDLIFVGRTQRGYEIDFDADVEWGCMPTESLMLSLAGCMGIDVMSMLKKMRIDVESFRIEVEGERNPAPPQYFNAIRMDILVTGKDITRKSLNRAVALSLEKYCSVYHSLHPDMKVSIDWRLAEA